MSNLEVCSRVNVFGLEDSIRAAKYAKAVDVELLDFAATPGILALAAAEPGSGHDVFLDGIIVQFDLAFTIKAWTEAERYHWLEFITSQSTMHCIMRFDIAKQCNEYVHPGIISILRQLVDQYNNDPTPENYLFVVYNIPTGFRLTARMTTDYRQLKTIYRQRKTHRLPEWRAFCAWIETLPMAKELILGGKLE